MVDFNIEQISALLKSFNIDLTSVATALKASSDFKGVDDLIAAWITDNIANLMDPIKDAIITTSVDNLRQTFETEIIDPITSTFTESIVTPLIDSFTLEVITPITDFITDQIDSLAVIPITSWLTDSLIETIVPHIQASITLKNSILDLTINPFLAVVPGEVKYHLAYDETDKIKVDTDHLFSDGEYFVGWILYDIFRRIYNSIFEIIDTTSDFFNDHIAGTELNFPIPFFSGKGIKIASKINNIWTPNDNLKLPTLTTWAEVKDDFPFLDVWPLNVQLADGVLFSTGIIFKNPNSSLWEDSTYKKSDLTYDFICIIIMALVTWLFAKVGFAAHSSKLIAKMTSQIPISPYGNVINNNVVYKKSLLSTMLTILSLMTKKTTNNFTAASNLITAMSGLSTLDGLFADGTVADSDLDPDIKAICEEIKLKVMSMYSGSYV